MDADRVVSAETALKIHGEAGNVFTGIGCFKGTFQLQVKDNVESYHVPLRHVTYAFQETFKKELERLQEH